MSIAYKAWVGFLVALHITALFTFYIAELNYDKADEERISIAERIRVIKDGKINEVNEGEVVAVMGIVQPEGELHDELIKLDTNALALIKQVEMYQWQEYTEKKYRDQGINETDKDYRRYKDMVMGNKKYSKRWSNLRIRSETFSESDEHPNPAFPDQYPYDKYINVANSKIGEFDVDIEALKEITFNTTSLSGVRHEYSESLLEQLEKYLLPVFIGPRSMGDISFNVFGEDLDLGEMDLDYHIKDNRMIYFKNGDEELDVGDMRVMYRIVPSGEYTIVGMQKEGRIVPFLDSTGEKNYLVYKGQVNAVQKLKERRYLLNLFFTRGFYGVFFFFGLITLAGSIPVTKNLAGPIGLILTAMIMVLYIYVL